MLGALKAVGEGTMSINRAATEYGVPKIILKDWVAGRVMHGSNPGPKQVMEEETQSAKKRGRKSNRNGRMRKKKEGREEKARNCQWLRCHCRRWLHEDCVTDLVDLKVDDCLY